MTLSEEQLAVVLQASIERAREMLEADGGFRPFGGRAKPSGDVEFVQLGPEGDAEAVDALYRRTAAFLAEEAQRGEILAAALVANAQMPGSETAIAVQIEAPRFCRSVVLPYRLSGSAVDLGRMIPEEAEPLVFP